MDALAFPNRHSVQPGVVEARSRPILVCLGGVPPLAFRCLQPAVDTVERAPVWYRCSVEGYTCRQRPGISHVVIDWAWPQPSSRSSHSTSSESSTESSSSFASATETAQSLFCEGMHAFQRGLFDQATAKYRKALRAQPDFLPALAAFADMQGLAARWEESLLYYRKVVEMEPTNALLRLSLADKLAVTMRVDEAIETCRQARALQPGLLKSLEVECYTRVRCCVWDGIDELMQELWRGVHAELAMGADVISVDPWNAATFQIDSALVRRITQAKANEVSRNATLLGCPPLDLRIRDPLTGGKRLRIGYVSSEFGDHPLGHLMGSMFGLHDRAKYEIFCYALRFDGSMEAWRIRRDVEHWVDASKMDNVELAQRISSDGVHIAVNLNGFTIRARNEVFALRCAPLQICFLGFPAAMCASWIDYTVADSVVAPPELHRCYGEALALLPRCFIVTDHKQMHAELIARPPPRRAKFGLQEGAMVYMCSNQLFKIDRVIFAVWCRILRRVPGSVLWLLRSPEAAEPRLQREAARHSVDPVRLIFTERMPKEEYLRRHMVADLFLDTPTYNAFTTGCDALWMGTPLVTLPLERMASRVAASLCQAVGLEREMVVRSLQDYEERAVQLGTDRSRCHLLRRRLEDARQSCLLFDTTGYVQDFERMMDAMWSHHAAGRSPASFAMPPAPRAGLEVLASARSNTAPATPLTVRTTCCAAQVCTGKTVS